MFWKRTDIMAILFTDFVVGGNKSILCICINIVYCTFVKPVLLYGPHGLVLKKVDVNISFIREDIKEKSSLLEVEKMYFN